MRLRFWLAFWSSAIFTCSATTHAYIEGRWGSVNNIDVVGIIILLVLAIIGIVIWCKELGLEESRKGI